MRRGGAARVRIYTPRQETTASWQLRLAKRALSAIDADQLPQSACVRAAWDCKRMHTARLPSRLHAMYNGVCNS
ncbi:hypothetical protein XarbCFBP8130_13755 [Xanthomonas arboricola]|nr:hypothetical protein XarbCFBP8130_13755 [Xanthomonas arboricola]PPU10107.1 hypothetical protein XarjCFBP1022_16775 [Xanthomonas arboricola]